MIAAVFGADSVDARERLDRIACAARVDGAAAELSHGRSLILAWPGTPSGIIRREERLGHVGTPHGPLGIDAPLSDLRGCFALVAVRGGGLLLGRGRFGGRPLFYANEAGGRVVVCSRLAPLAATLDRPLQLDDEKLAAMVAGGTPSLRSRTVYRGIRRVLPGEWIQLAHDAAAVHRLSGLRISPLSGASTDDVVRELRRQITAAIARAVVDTERVAVVVSGGLDSSAILALVLALSRGASKREVQALNLVFGGTGDDRPHMKVLEAALGIVAMRFRPADGAPHVIPSFVVDGSPYPWPTCGWDVAMGLAAKHSGASVLLSGHGGDDMFQGDPGFFLKRARRGQALDALVRAARLDVYWSASALERMYLLVVRPLLSSAIPASVRRGVRGTRRRGRVAYEWAGPSLHRYFEERADAAGSTNQLPCDGSFISELALGDMCLEVRDARAQFEELTGSVSVDPFLDDDLAEFCASIPPEMFFLGNKSRGLYREALFGLIPDSIRLRTDKARFERGLGEMFRALDHGALDRFAAMTALGDLGLVQPARYRPRYEAFARNPETPNDWSELWPAIGIEAFVQRFREGAALSSARSS